MARPVQWKRRNIWPSVATSGSLAKVSALAELLFLKMIPQADDQGRLCGDIEMIKILCVPRTKQITLENLPELVDELSCELIKLYSASNDQIIQLVSWWEYQPQGMLWAYPSQYPPPEGWTDHKRYRKGGEVVTENWPP